MGHEEPHAKFVQAQLQIGDHLLRYVCVVDHAYNIVGGIVRSKKRGRVFMRVGHAILLHVNYYRLPRIKCNTWFRLPVRVCAAPDRPV